MNPRRDLTTKLAIISWLILMPISSLLIAFVLNEKTGNPALAIVGGASLGVVGSWYLLGISMWCLKKLRRGSLGGDEEDAK